MLILLAIYGLVIYRVVGHPSSKEVDAGAGMKIRTETVDGGDWDPYSVIKVRPSFESGEESAEVWTREKRETREKTEKREVIENAKTRNAWRLKRSVELKTKEPENETKIGNDASPTTTEVTTSTKMSHIMKIEPRDRESDFQEKRMKRENPETKTEPQVTEKAQKDLSSTIKPADGTIQTTTQSSPENTKIEPSSPVSTTPKPSDSTPTVIEVKGGEGSKGLTETSKPSDKKEGGTNVKGWYTFPTRFFRHRNFLHEVPFQDKSETKNTASEETTKQQEEKGQVEAKAGEHDVDEKVESGRPSKKPWGPDQHESDDWQQNRRLEETSKPPSFNLDIRYLGGNDLPIPPVDVSHFDPAEVRAYGEGDTQESGRIMMDQEEKVPGVPPASHSAQNMVSFGSVMTSIVTFFVLRT